MFMEEKYNILCTGLTKKEFMHKLKSIEKRKKKVPKRCYLCHRQEGDIAIGVNLNAKNS